MRTYLGLTTILVFALCNCVAQTTPLRESIGMHLNTHLFVTGETVLFTIHCKTGEKLSELSSVAYVEVINNELTPVFQFKIKLDHGVGYGDFFLTGKIPSGNYTIIAYTRWMRNFPN